VAPDRVNSDKEGSGDFLIRAACCREFSDAALGGRQLAGSAGAPRTDAAEFGAGARSPSGGADLFEGREEDDSRLST
jgi:hypothetical protein